MRQMMRRDLLKGPSCLHKHASYSQTRTQNRESKHRIREHLRLPATGLRAQGISGVMGGEEGGILTKVRSEKTMADNPGYNPHSGEYLLNGGLDGVDWVKQLKSEPGAQTVLSVGAMASQGGDIDPDHMVRARPCTRARK